MALAQWHGFIDPVMRVLSDGQKWKMADIRKAVSARQQLTDDELAEVLPSGEARWSNRVNWAVFDSFKAGLLNRAGRGEYQISEEGRRRVATGNEITVDTLFEYEDYRTYRKPPVNDSAKSTPVPLESVQTLTEEAVESNPTESLEEAAQKLNQRVIDDIYRNLLELSPESFELLIPLVVKALGYGTDREDNLKPTQRSGDKGIDGIVWQDALGFDRVYLQAKRYSEGNNVGSPEVQAFSGALGQFRATKGIFITTSSFTSGARAVAKDTAHYTLILIDGQQLAQLMFDYGVGVQIERTVVVKKIDQDFFERF